jgi:hypothetical protein
MEYCLRQRPFQLKGDRSRLNETGWNDWLTAQAADPAAELITI